MPSEPLINLKSRNVCVDTIPSPSDNDPSVFVVNDMNKIIQFHKVDKTHTLIYEAQGEIRCMTQCEDHGFILVGVKNEVIMLRPSQRSEEYEETSVFSFEKTLRVNRLFKLSSNVILALVENLK